MKIRLLTRRYARAFLDNIPEGQYDALSQDIETIREFIRNNPDVIQVLKSVITPKKMRIALLDAIVDRKESAGIVLNLRKQWRGLFNVLVSKHRMKIISEIIDEIEFLLLERENRARIVIRLAREHEPEVIKRILGYAGKLSGRELIPRTEIDPSIIGGFVATIDSVRIDGSVQHNLEKFKKVRKR